jgi:hypothetical protein
VKKSSITELDDSCGVGSEARGKHHHRWVADGRTHIFFIVKLLKEV